MALVNGTEYYFIDMQQASGGNTTRHLLKDTNGRAMIAPTEASSTASAAHAKGSYFIYGTTLYQATADIASGGTITPNTNCKAVALSSEVCDLKSAIDYNEPNYTGGYELGKISTTTGNNNSSTAYVRTSTFFDQDKAVLITFKDAVSYVDIFDYLTDGTYQTYTRYLKASSAVVDGVLTISPQDGHKYRADFFTDGSTAISDISAFMSAHYSVKYNVVNIADEVESLKETVNTLEGTVNTLDETVDTLAGTVDTLAGTVDTLENYIGYSDPTYTGGFELGKISQTTGNNNNSTTRIRTVGFLDNSHDSLIVISQAVQLQVFEYLADGTFNDYYINLVYNDSQNHTHNALVISNGVITVQSSTQYKYRLSLYNYPTETTIVDVNAFVQSNISITHTDVKLIPDALAEIRADIEELENPQIKKTWVCYGDSITQMDLYENDVRNMLGITTLYRRGISGCSIAVNSASAAVAGENSSIYYRIVNEVNFPDSPDIITILGGINDYYYGSPLGNMDSTDTSTVYGALKAICEKLAAYSYGPKIAFITPTKKTPGQASSAIDTTVTQEQIRKAVIDVAGAYGYPVIDLGGTCGINSVNAVRETDPTTSDGTHWSATGQALCIPIIADGIRKLYFK